MNGGMNMPEPLVEICKQFEGFHKEVRMEAGVRATPYICPAGYWTIGYGHLCDASHPPITEERAEGYLTQDLSVAVAGALRYCPVLLNEPANRLSAIASFAFNLGVGRLQTSTLRRRVNQRDWESAGQELLRWVYGGGRILPGLVRRRQAEHELLLAGAYS